LLISGIFVHVRDVNETRESRVSIFFSIPGKEFLDFRELRLTRPPDNRPLVSGIIVTCRSLSDCHSLSLASVKSRLVLPFWYRLTQVVPGKGPLNGCVCDVQFVAFYRHAVTECMWATSSAGNQPVIIWPCGWCVCSAVYSWRVLSAAAVPQQYWWLLVCRQDWRFWVDWVTTESAVDARLPAIHR